MPTKLENQKTFKNDFTFFNISDNISDIWGLLTTLNKKGPNTRIFDPTSTYEKHALWEGITKVHQRLGIPNNYTPKKRFCRRNTTTR